MQLPPRGSAQDKLLEEIHQRDRAERFSQVELFARLFAHGLQVRSDLLEAMLHAYKDELTQVKYTPAYAAYQRRRKVEVVSKKVKKKLDDEALLKKLEGLTAPDEKAPVTKAGARRR